MFRHTGAVDYSSLDITLEIAEQEFSFQIDGSRQDDFDDMRQFMISIVGRNQETRINTSVAPNIWIRPVEVELWTRIE